MNKKILLTFFAALCVLALCMCAGCVANETDSGDGTITITDSAGREVVLPDNITTVGTYGAASTRFITYLDAVDMLVGVSSNDKTVNVDTEGRPYMLAHPEIANVALIGTSDSFDPELALTIKPDVIFLTTEDAAAANEAYEKAGIPIVCFYPYDPVTQFDKFSESILMMGKVLGKEERANEVIDYFANMKADLIARTPDISMDEKPVVYIGGIGNRGPHGLQSTKPDFIGFTLLSANQKAADVTSSDAATIAKEKILEWDPDILFIDLDTSGAADGGALLELKNDASYQELNAVKTGEIYAIPPDTRSWTNYGTSFANAYFVGTILYPEQFKDIDAKKKADEIYAFLVGEPIFDQLYKNTGSLAYQKVDLSTI